MPDREVNKYSNRSPDFLMGLGGLYVLHNLLEPAEEVLAQIPLEDPVHIEAAKFRMEIQFRKQNYQEVIRLAEKYLEEADLPGWLATRIGIAYYCLGQVDAAKSYLSKSAENFPKNTRVIDKLRSLRPHPSLPGMEDLIRAVLEKYVSPHVALDCIAPILCGGRTSSCCFEDQLFPDGRPGKSDLDEEDFYLEFAADLYQRFGIFTAFLPYVHFSPGQCFSLRKVFFSFDPSVYDQVEDVRQSAWIEFEKQEDQSSPRLEYIEKEGHLLGYPKCCVDWVLRNRRANQSIEILALRALIEEEFASSFGPPKIPFPELAYFSFEFYPCSPRCNAAEEVGNVILKQYKKTGAGLTDLYRQHILQFNKARLYYPDHPYTDFVIKFNNIITHTFKLGEFKKKHQDFELYRKDIIAVLDESPDLEEDPDALLIAYEIARERLAGDSYSFTTGGSISSF